MHMLRTCEEVWGEVGIIQIWGGSWDDLIGVLEFACSTALHAFLN